MINEIRQLDQKISLWLAFFIRTLGFLAWEASRKLCPLLGVKIVFSEGTTFNDGRGSFTVDFTLLTWERFSIDISFIVLFFDS